MQSSFAVSINISGDGVTSADDTDLATKVTGKEMAGDSSGLTVYPAVTKTNDTDLATKVTGKGMAGVSSGLSVNPAVKPTSKAP